MANCSDAFGTITVERVGKEFLEFLNKVQDKDAYYSLVELDNLAGVEPDENNNLHFDFSTMGRWYYGSNINGYLQGEWLNEGERKEAYDTFINAMKDKNGKVSIDYTDSDTSMDWMGTGSAVLQAEEGGISFNDDFEEQGVTLKGYAELYGYSNYEALEYVYGDEVASAYNEYADKTEKEGKTPLEVDDWYYTIYEQE